MRNLTFLLLAAAVCLMAQAAGTYAGTWKSTSSKNSGKLSLNFTRGKLSGASFTLSGQNVEAKPVLSKVDQNHYSFSFEYDLDGVSLRCMVDGTLNETSMRGSYRTVPADGGAPVDEGTWETTQQ